MNQKHEFIKIGFGVLLCYMIYIGGRPPANEMPQHVRHKIQYSKTTDEENEIILKNLFN